MCHWNNIDLNKEFFTSLIWEGYGHLHINDFSSNSSFAFWDWVFNAVSIWKIWKEPLQDCWCPDTLAQSWTWIQARECCLFSFCSLWFLIVQFEPKDCQLILRIKILKSKVLRYFQLHFSRILVFTIRFPPWWKYYLLKLTSSTK